MRILLAEDEKELSKALTAILKYNHYSVDAVYDGADAFDYGVAENYDAIILDIMMPKKNGIEVLEELRKNGVTTPVLILTAKSEIDDRITGLTPVRTTTSPSPLRWVSFLARLRAMTRRRSEYTPDIISVGNIKLDRSTFELSSEHASFRLGNKEFQMMEILMRESGRIITTDNLLERIWGYDAETDNSVVWVYISYLRKKLTALGANVEIKAVRGVGYSLAESEGGKAE